MARWPCGTKQGAEFSSQRCGEKMSDDLRKDYKDEYFKLQDQYEVFDQRSLQIKGWIASAAVAGVALGFDKAGRKVWIVVAVIAACVWLLEAFWKMFQYGFRDRIRTLEGYFRGLKD